MTYIYCITNIKNNKKYINSCKVYNEEKILNDFQLLSQEKDSVNIPIAQAIKIYGLNNFNITLLEEIIDDSIIEQKITYWINYYDTYNNGYNIFKTGPSTKYKYDKNLIIETYSKLQNCTETAKVIGCCVDVVYNTLKQHNIKIKSSGEIHKEKNAKYINMYDKDNNLLNTFFGSRDAAKYLYENKFTNSISLKGIAGHILQVCNNKRQTAYGFIWRFASDE